MKKLLSLIMLCLFFSRITVAAIANAENMNIYDAYEAIKEYLMDFGKYDGKKLYDILTKQKDHPAYDYIIFTSTSDNIFNPLESYVVHIAERYQKEETLILQYDDGINQAL